MGSHNVIIITRNWVMNIRDYIMDSHKYRASWISIIRDIHNWVMDIHDSLMDVNIQL